MRYLKNVGDDIYWQHEDPVRAEGTTAPYFRQPVVEVPIRAVGDNIKASDQFEPNPAFATLTVVNGETETDVEVEGAVTATGVTATLDGDDAGDFEVVT